MTYASFWKRAAASIVDGLIYGAACGIIGQIIGLGAGLVLGVSGNGEEPSVLALLVLAGLSFGVQVAGYVLYYVWPECSAWQATIGKKIFGLKVTDEFGRRIGFGRSLGRNVGMIVSALILGIGYLMCIWTQKKQCLHDQMAGCLVLDQTPNEKQGCAIGVVIGLLTLWVVLIAGIVAAISVPFVGGFQRGMEKAENRALVAKTNNLLIRVRIQQHRYFNEHARYADDWEELNLPIADDETFCFSPGQACNAQHKLKVFLLDDEAKALRINTTHPYELTMPYEPNEPLECESESDQCAVLGF